MKAYYITSDTHIRKIGLIVDDTAEILKFKNCSVGNFVKYIYLSFVKRRRDLALAVSFEIILKADFRSPSADMFREFGWHSIESRL